MPKEGVMAQISRPFQIVLVVFGLFVAVWAVALRGHSSSSNGTASTPAAGAPAPSASAQAPKAAKAAKAARPSPIYHGPAPGLEGLSRDIARAHGAVGAAQQKARQIQEKAGEAPSTTGSSSASAPATGASKASATTPAPAGKASVGKAPSSPATSVSTGPANQAAVERELEQGKIVLVLFWNPKGTDDVIVHDELQLMIGFHRGPAVAKAEEVRHGSRFFGKELDQKIAVHEVSAAEVASFGSITRGVQVYTTPTLLIINGHRQVTTLTGATDAYSIEQAIEEAHKG
jgi:hypothetical protein